MHYKHVLAATGYSRYTWCKNNSIGFFHYFFLWAGVLVCYSRLWRLTLSAPGYWIRMITWGGGDPQLYLGALGLFRPPSINVDPHKGGNLWPWRKNCRKNLENLLIIGVFRLKKKIVKFWFFFKFDSHILVNSHSIDLCFWQNYQFFGVEKVKKWGHRQYWVANF